LDDLVELEHKRFVFIGYNRLFTCDTHVRRLNTGYGNGWGGGEEAGLVDEVGVVPQGWARRWGRRADDARPRGRWVTYFEISMIFGNIENDISDFECFIYICLL
jgi:hypothetical protein